ncbi:LysR family transcriptional regulator [Parahaliea mediterranea]|uniref:LysR family transcriptional regulator n=1 Tax=Parahaliea mediterranea TaxID=651086 RepID=A0A939DFQ1_9GAMM|nr:LysR family transcriptional regulator [Parahaliea mediterranea]MBN7797329.1 LysR family transcriptional regulator [Parahaliea mediterranea]
MEKDIFYLLKVFCCVVEQGSFSRAADQLGVQGPAVSKAVARLEEQLGKRLFNRTTRTLEVTEAGRLLYRDGVEQLVSLRAVLGRIESRDDLAQGTLGITATPAVGERLAYAHIADFKRRYPGVSLSLNLTNEMIKLPSQSIDIALRSSSRLEDSSLTSQHLFNVRRVIVASPSYLAEHGTPDTPARIGRHRCLNFFHRRAYDNWAYTLGDARAEVATHSEVSCNSYAAIKGLCLGGLGLARLFEYQVEAEIRSGELVCLLPDVDWGSQAIHAIYHGKMGDSPKVRAFIEHLKRM